MVLVARTQLAAGRAQDIGVVYLLCVTHAPTTAAGCKSVVFVQQGSHAVRFVGGGEEK